MHLRSHYYNNINFWIQVKAICDLKRRFDVDVTIDTGECKISLYGTKDEISKASYEYHMIILEALHSKHREKCISDSTQWVFFNDLNDSNECIEYPSNINRIIEEAYRKQDKEIKFTNECGAEYTINFQTMNTFPSVHKTSVSVVARKHKGAIYSHFYNYHSFLNVFIFLYQHK